MDVDCAPASDAAAIVEKHLHQPDHARVVKLDPSDPSITILDRDNDRLPDPLDPDENLPDTDGDRIRDDYEACHIDLEAAVNAEALPWLGDVNHDEFRDNADTQLILNFFAWRFPSVFFSSDADVTRDGLIDNVDAYILLAFFAYRYEYLPYGN